MLVSETGYCEDTKGRLHHGARSASREAIERGPSVGKDEARRKAEEIDKLKELVLLVSDLAQGDENFGMVKLNKLLFAIDFRAYAELGQAVTGAEYQKLDNGPALRKMLRIKESLEQESPSAFAVRHEAAGEYTRDRPIALRPPDYGWFSADELHIAKDEVNKYWGKSADEMIAMSHDFIGWKLSRTGETIPYESVFAMDSRPPTERERNVGLRLIESAKAADAGGAT